jgi:hypothetical protein
MCRKLALLLDNQDEEDHLAIIQDNAHILFGTGHSTRRKGKYKYDREELDANIRAVHLKDQMTVRNLAGLVGLPTTTVQRFLKPNVVKRKKDGEEPLLVRHSSAL